ncbi:MAG: TolC family protein [Nitrospirae bacterium]|nr:TolC family protein [Nitrospirota bacterium]
MIINHKVFLDILRVVEYINAYMRYLSFIFLLILLPATLCPLPVSFAVAQDTLTLKRVIEEAKLNNPSIQALRQNMKAKEAGARAEGILDDPRLKIEMMDLSKENPFPIPGNAMQTRYEVSQMLPYPGKLQLERRIALLEVMMSEAELQSKELETITMVKEAYYEYLLLTTSIRTLEEIKGLLSSMIRIAETKYAVGEVSQQDVIKAQVELTMLLNEVLELEAEKDVVHAEIKALLNRPQDDNTLTISSEKLPEEKVKLDLGSLTNKALEVNPELKLMKYEVENKESEVELTRKNYYPDFMLGIAPIQRDGRFDAWDAMFQINIPLWRAKYENQVGERVNMADAMRSRVKAEENMINAKVKEGVVKVETADRITMLYVTSLIPQAELSFESALKNYQSGRVDFLTLLDTERLLKKTKIDYIEAVTTYYKRLVLLERVVGEELH